MLFTDMMTSLAGLLTTWPLAVRLISFTCLALGICISLPFVLLILYDFFLWIWRTFQKYALSRTSTQQRTVVASNSSSSVRKPLSTKFE